MQIKNGEIIEGKITGITKYGAFVKIVSDADGETNGMIHISEISDSFIKDITKFLEINQTVRAVVIGSNENGKLALSLKQTPKDTVINRREESNEMNETPEEFVKTGKNTETSRSFEDMMNKFKRDSDEKISALKYLEPKKSGSPRRRKD